MKWRIKSTAMLAWTLVSLFVIVTVACEEQSLFLRSPRHESSRRSRGSSRLAASWTSRERAPRFVQPAGVKPRVLRLAVLAPSDRDHQFSLSKILPAITLAARTVESASAAGRGPLPGWRIQIVDRDSKCSSIFGPLEAFDLYNNKAIGS